jgi:HEAT repeat protein
VREAIEALESAGDESLIPELEPFLEHDDEGVRDGARETIKYLE